jgi:hypothetical protein
MDLKEFTMYDQATPTLLMDIADTCAYTILLFDTEFDKSTTFAVSTVHYVERLLVNTHADPIAAQAFVELILLTDHRSGDTRRTSTFISSLAY